MPTITEPPTNEQPKPQPETAPAEPELFAAEIAMEGKSHDFAPWLLAIALVLLLGGFIYYFISTTRETLSVAQATATVNGILRGQGPAIVRFSAGTVEPNNGQQDPLYKLLTKAGIVVTKPKPKDAASLLVEITEPGQTVLSNIDGVQKTMKDQVANYSVPLAERKLVSIDKVTLLRPHVAKVDYTWEWMPNRLGREFDADGQLVQSFSAWERETLIRSYSVDFYNAAPTKTSIVLMKPGDEPWQPYRE